MTSNDRSAAFEQRTATTTAAGHTPPNEKTLKTDKIQIERKAFHFSLKENPRGRFLRITEDVNGRRDTIIVPAPGLDDFARILAEFARASAESPEPVE